MAGGAAGWLLSALFAGTGAWFLVRLAGELRTRHPGSGERAASSGLHALMSAGMISMFWSWGTGIPPIGLAVVFTGAAAWFVGRAMFAPVAAGTSRGSGDAGLAAVIPGSARLVSWYQAAMMAAMVWMAVAVSVPAAVPSQPGAAGVSPMPGMSMSMSALSGGGAAVPASWVPASWVPASWVAAVCLAAGLAFAAATAWYGVILVCRVRVAANGGSGFRGAVAHDTASAVAAAGMAAALLMMA